MPSKLASRSWSQPNCGCATARIGIDRTVFQAPWKTVRITSHDLNFHIETLSIQSIQSVYGIYGDTHVSAVFSLSTWLAGSVRSHSKQRSVAQTSVARATARKVGTSQCTCIQSIIDTIDIIYIVYTSLELTTV